MGQGASVPRRRRKKKSKKSSTPSHNDPALLKLEDRIAMVKQDLIRTKQEGEVNKRGQEDDIYKFEMELYKKKYLLHKRGNDAKTYLSFWDYVEIVNTVLHPADESHSVGSGEMTIAQHKAKQMAAEKEKRKGEQGTIIKHTGQFNIYSFFEAFLLRRLHIAMILKHQRAKQSDVWNDVIMFLYDMMPGIKKRTAAANEKFISLKPESNETMREMIKLQKKKIKLYDRMIESLKEEVREELMASSMDDDKLLEDLDVPTQTVGASDGAEELNTAKYYQTGGRYQDDDEMSFKSMGSKKSSRSSRSKRNKNRRNSNTEQAPRWKKSSRSKMSKAINRDMNASFSGREPDVDMSSRSPSPSSRAPTASSAAAEAAAAAEGDTSKITDEDIERFLYPNKPVRKSGAARVKTPSGVGSGRELPSELEFSDDQDNRTTISKLHDDVSSVGSGSMRGAAGTRGVDDNKAKNKNDLEKLGEEE